MGGQDELEITIEEDGTITTKTDQVSPANHKAADDFLAFVQKLAGGEASRTKRKQGHSHSQTKQHVHHKH